MSGKRTRPWLLFLALCCFFFAGQAYFAPHRDIPLIAALLILASLTMHVHDILKETQS